MTMMKIGWALSHSKERPTNRRQNTKLNDNCHHVGFESSCSSLSLASSLFMQSLTPHTNPLADTPNGEQNVLFMWHLHIEIVWVFSASRFDRNKFILRIVPTFFYFSFSHPQKCFRKHKKDEENMGEREEKTSYSFWNRWKWLFWTNNEAPILLLPTLLSLCSPSREWNRRSSNWN